MNTLYSPLQETCLLLQLAAFFSLVPYRHAANILYVIPCMAYSHYNSLHIIGLQLAIKGHNVTVITPLKETEHPQSYHQVIIEIPYMTDRLGGEILNSFQIGNHSSECFIRDLLWPSSLLYTETVLNSTSVQNFLKKDNKFDLVICELFFHEAVYALAIKYNAPLILVATFGNCMRQNFLSRNPLQHATVVSEYLNLADPESFWGRLRNFCFTVYEYFWWRFEYLAAQETLVKIYLPDLPQPMPSLHEIAQSASLVLYNGHFSFDGPIAYLPNIIEIGGIHIKDRNENLPNNVQIILNKAKYGIVYVNFGSTVLCTDLPEDKKNAFLNAFRKLKQIIIWKWEDKDLENKSNNIIIGKWLPQNEILRHPNVKLFISHGGLLGIQEAIYHGVPILGVPLFGDQYNNLLQVQNKGFGKILQYHDITENNLSDILKIFFKDNIYHKKAREASQRFKDRPMSPLNTAMYWIEYVLRNNGAEHMKNPALKLKWIEYAMLDIYAFILMIFFIIFFVIFKFISFIFKSQSQRQSIAKNKYKKKD